MSSRAVSAWVKTTGMVVQHNMNAINSYNKLNANVAGMKKSSEKLSSGYRINRAGDDAAGLAVSEKMRSQIKGLNQAIRNSQDGINMIQTFEGAAQETHSILQRMKELASQSANGTYDDPTDRAAIQLEFDQLNDELNQIADTDFNGTIVLNGGQMADGTKAVNNKFDYANSERNPMQLDKSFVTRLDSQLVDTSATNGTNADSVWAKVFDNVNRIDADGTNDGPESFEITLRYDETAATVDKKWVGVEATNGAKLDQITVTGTANGGFNLTAITGFIVLFIAGIPVFISGVLSIIMPGLIVSALGIRLIALSIAKGQTRRTATIPHSATVIHFGAFLNSNLKASTASTIQLADMLILTTVRNNSLIIFLLSEIGQSSAELHQSPPRKFFGAL